jgi:hypothetical protein
MAAAANLQQLNDYLRDTLLIADQGVREALNQQGLTSFEDFATLTKDDMKNICSNVCKPGGQIPNPNAGLRNQPAMIANHGVQLGHVYERRLEQLRYFIYHCIRIQREIDPPSMTLARLQMVYHLKEMEDASDDEKAIALPKPITKIDEIRTHIEDLDDYLMRKRGESGLYLAYVVRDEIAPPVAIDDPGFGQPDFTLEMVRRGNHNLPSFHTDNKDVWSVIRHITHGGPAWSWVSQFARANNGRDAYLSLKAHYLGPSFQARIKAAADSTLSKNFWDGNRNFTLEMYASTLSKAYTDMEVCGEPVPESRKVRIFLNGISHPSLFAAKGIVSATATLNTSFDSTVNFLIEEYDKIKSLTVPKRSVSAMTSSAGGNAGTGGNKRGKPIVHKGNSTKGKKRKFMSKQEWWALTQDQRDEIMKERSDRKRNSSRRTESFRNVSTVTSANVSPSVISDITPVTPNTPNTPSTASRNVSAVTRRILPNVS